MNKTLTIQDYDLLQSKTFNWLRFPLIFFILFIHTISLKEFTDSALILGIEYFIRRILAGLGVPFFFVVSGYYFFYSKTMENCLTRNSYFAKLKKRTKTLLIPYLFWNLLVVLFYFFAPRILNGFNPAVQVNTMNDVIMSLWCYPDTPINYPLWYMRDLIVAVIFSPLLYLLIRYLKFLPILVAGIVYIGGVNFFNILRFDLFSQTLFFFPLGAYFAIEQRNIVKFCRSLSFYPTILYIIITILDVILKNEIIHKLTIIMGLLVIFNIVSYYIGKGYLRENKTLSNASFFIYAFHSVPILIVANRMVDIFPHKDWAYVLIFFSSVIIVALLGLGLYVFLKRFSPRFTSIITGGR